MDPNLAMKSLCENAIYMLIDLVNRVLTQQKLSVRLVGRGESLGSKRDLVEQGMVRCVGLR